MNKTITQRLSRDSTYKKTKKSYQDTLSPAEIKKKLEEYMRVENVLDVDLNSHLRYYTFNIKTGKKQFRLGGFLSKKNKEKQYLILSN